MAFGYNYNNPYNSNYNSPYGAVGFNSQPPFVPPTAPNIQQNVPLRSNKIFVTSLEEAIQRPSDFNTSIVYYDQDKPLMYNITTDGVGKKTSEIFEIVKYVPKQPDMAQNGGSNDFVTRQEHNALIQQFQAIQSQLHALTHPTQPVQETIDNIE